MNYTYIAAWSVLGVMLPDGTQSYEIGNSDCCRFILTRDPDGLLTNIDRHRAIGPEGHIPHSFLRPVRNRNGNVYPEANYYVFEISPQAFLLASIFFFTIDQVFVVRNDSGQPVIMRMNISKGTLKVISSVFRFFRSEGSHPPITALSFPSDKYLSGHVTILVQPAPKGEDTASKSLVTKVAS